MLAAGEGKRLKSDLPKPLHPVCGRPVLWHILKAADALGPERLIVVVGRGKDRVIEDVGGYGLRAPTPSSSSASSSGPGTRSWSPRRRSATPTTSW